mmetsp:Transcript_15351/g.47569  ORF Transcript_15351/g.47569 Transcript_15351/m.47569 type:complete len:83 (-) Transcript_15351:452-700(-)
MDSSIRLKDRLYQIRETNYGPNMRDEHRCLIGIFFRDLTANQAVPPIPLLIDNVNALSCSNHPKQTLLASMYTCAIFESETM